VEKFGFHEGLVLYADLDPFG
jgi:hypothetical protein